MVNELNETTLSQFLFLSCWLYLHHVICWSIWVYLAPVLIVIILYFLSTASLLYSDNNISAGEETYQARARSWRWDLFSRSPPSCLKCSGRRSSHRVRCLCLLLVLLLYQTNGGLICACRKPCKVGIKYMEDGSKVRVSRGIGASGSIIPRPEILKMRTTPRPTVGNFQILGYLCMCFSVSSIYSERVNLAVEICFWVPVRDKT